MFNPSLLELRIATSGGLEFGLIVKNPWVILTSSPSQAVAVKFSEGAPNMGTSAGITSKISSYSDPSMSVGYLRPLAAWECHCPIMNCSGSRAGGNGIGLSSRNTFWVIFTIHTVTYWQEDLGHTSYSSRHSWHRRSLSEFGRSRISLPEPIDHSFDKYFDSVLKGRIYLVWFKSNQYGWKI